MNTLLQEKIAALGGNAMPMMMAEGGEVDTNPLDLQDPQVQADIAVSAECQRTLKLGCDKRLPS